ncbi:MAG: hypothetical protein Q4C71_00175 [Microbacteriaceae bacterium]|nr:hypothetical protein [Microbacteriaceae bacterium]
MQPHYSENEPNAAPPHASLGHDSAAGTFEQSTAAFRKKRRRKRLIMWLGGTFGTLLLLAVLAEILLRIFVPMKTAEMIRKTADLGPESKIEMQIGGLLVPQILTGKVHNLSAQIYDFKLPQNAGFADVKVWLGAVEIFPATFKLENATVAAQVNNRQFTGLLRHFAPQYVDSAEIHDGYIYGAKNLNVYGRDIPLSVRVSGSAGDGGGLVLTPHEVSASGVAVTPEELERLAGGQIGEFAQQYGGPVEICLDSWLPHGVRLDTIVEQENKLTVLVNLDENIVRDKRLQKERGKCEPPGYRILK